MPGRSQPTAQRPRQLALPLSANEKFSWLRIASFGMPQAAERTLRRLLEKLAAKAERNFDTPTREELAGELDVSLATIDRAIRAGRRLGVLVIEPQRSPGGQRPNRYRIEWQAVYRHTPAGRSHEQSGAVDSETATAGDEAPRQIDEAPRQFDDPIKKNFPSTSPETFQPPPPTPSAPIWGEGEEEELRGVLEELGVALSDKTVREARERGVLPGEVRALVEHYQAHRAADCSAWGAGALQIRIERQRPGGDPSAFWPKPDAAWEARRRKAEVSRSSPLRGHSAALRNHQRDKSAIAALREQFGAALDALTVAQARELLTAELPQDSHRDFRLQRLASGGKAAVELDLLEALERRERRREQDHVPERARSPPGDATAENE